jgi:transcriptional regulator with XRE-family HTH domain
MMNTGQRIHILRKELNLTLVEFAKKVKVTHAHLSAIENGKNPLSPLLSMAICNVFNVREAWLLRGEEPIYEELLPGALDFEKDFVPIRLLADRAAGGDPAAVDERDVEGQILVPRERVKYDPKFYTCIRIRGDSMAPLLKPGTIVCICHRERDIKKLNKKTAAMYIKDEGVVVKRLIKSGEGYILMPENLAGGYAPRIFNPASDRIIGKIVCWLGWED